MTSTEMPAHAAAAKYAWDIGLDLTVMLYTQLLGDDSGIPESAKERFPTIMPLKLDAAYQKQMAAVWGEDDVQLNLSFDSLTACCIPYYAISHVVLRGPPLDMSHLEKKEEKPPTPGLRLVT